MYDGCMTAKEELRKLDIEERLEFIRLADTGISVEEMTILVKHKFRERFLSIVNPKKETVSSEQTASR